MSTVVQEPEALLERFGLSSFRPGQKEVIQAILDGCDCLCIMPTGGGKSLCFQIPALMRDGLVVVISPLIALMKDQVDALQKLGIRATFVNSSLEPSEQRHRLDAIAAGQFDLVYIAPERLRSPRFLETLRQVTVQLLAVDEAHCISEWGHDFRPDYSRIGRFREKLGWPPTIALTATATPEVRQDVIVQLNLRTPKIFITGFARPNLRFECEEPQNAKDKNELVAELIQEAGGASLVYASTRKRCEELVAYLKQQLRRPIGLYHAGLSPEERRGMQDDFMSGQVPVIVATNAFGMGIDKRDLRLVVHYNLPGTLEAYYQEAGRAGRDGLPSRCVLLFTYADRFVQEFFIENRYPERDVVRKVYEFLRERPEDPIELTLQQIKDTIGLPITTEGVSTCEQLLEKCGAIERLDSQQNQASVKIDSKLPTLVDMLPREAKIQRKVLRALEDRIDDQRGEWVFFPLQHLAAELDLDRDSLNRAIRELLRLEAFDYVPPFRGRALHLLKRDTRFKDLEIDFAEMARRKARDLEKLETVIRYAQTSRCRQLEILDYFGDPQRKKCEQCDNCGPPRPLAAQPKCELAEDKGIVDIVRIVLSGSARARERIGKELLAMMLTGSSSARVAKLRLDKLSTYGLLSELRQSDVSELIDAVIEARLLCYLDLDKFRAVLTLTELGQQVMRGQTALPSRFVLSAALLSRLRATKWRSGAEQKGSSGPSIGEVRSDQPAVASSAVADDPSATSEAIDVEEPETAPVAASPSNHYWTWRLLSDGYPKSACLAIRAIDERTMVGHLLQAVQDGLDVDPSWFLSNDQQASVERLFDDGSQPLRLEDLPVGLTVDKFELFREIVRRTST